MFSKDEKKMLGVCVVLVLLVSFFGVRDNLFAHLSDLMQRLILFALFVFVFTCGVLVGVSLPPMRRKDEDEHG